MTTVKCRLFSVSDAAEYLGCSRPTVYQLMWSGALQYRQVGSRKKFTLEDLESYLESVACTGRVATGD